MEELLKYVLDIKKENEKFYSQIGLTDKEKQLTKLHVQEIDLILAKINGVVDSLERDNEKCNLASVISCFLKETATDNKDKFSTITIQMRDNELQVQGHTAIPYGQGWGKWLVKESSVLNNL